ncbi:MAG: efflux RND transporter permease subunit [Crocinitomicaceae bacterium]|nr:efflux RND transporter permease subunit [Crocinitomicaceae bacterium]
MENKNSGFGLSTLAVNNRKTVFLILVIILLGGYGAYNSMPKENFPELQIPEIYVGIAKPGSSPQYMSEKIAKSVEKEIGGIKLVDEINTNSVHGYTTIRIKFDFKMSVDKALQKVKDAVDDARAKSDFPQLPVEPNIFELDPSQMPIMNINLRGENPALLKEIAENLEDQIEDLSQISEVDIRGTQTQEMRIEVDPIRAQSVNVTIEDIQNAVNSEHQTISGGEILEDGVRKTVRIDGEFRNAEELKKIIIKQDDFLPVKLEDVAHVEFGNGDTTSYAREFGSPVVMLDIKKQGGENLLDASDSITKILERASLDGTIPSSVSVSRTSDQSNNTRDMVSNLLNSIIFGIILVVGVLLFFLGLRNALFVGVAIPLSMLMSFLILNSMGVTMNVMVLFSLVLALGMLVDNGIVTVENIYRHMAEGKSSTRAVIDGVGEIAMPIIASTATTLAAFIPLAFWPGIMGEFMKYLPITLIIVLGSSLFVALVINPVLAVAYMKVTSNKPKKKRVIRNSIVLTGIGVIMLILGGIGLGNFLIVIAIIGLLNLFILYPGTVKFQNGFLPRLERGYEKFLNFALKGKKPLVFFLGTFIVLFLSIMAMSIFPPKIDFFPVNEPNYANIFISHPIGTDITVTNETTKEIEDLLTNDILKEYIEKDEKAGLPQDRRLIKSIISQVGEGTSDPAQGVTMGNTPHKARVTVNFVESQYRNGVTSSQVLKEIQQKLQGEFNADIEITAAKDAAGPPQGAPISMDITGKVEYGQLISEAKKIQNYLDGLHVEGVEKLKLNVEADRPEIPIRVDRDQIRKLNASTYQVGMAIRKALLGQDITTYTKGDESYDIVVKFNKKNRESIDALLNQRLIFRNNKGKLLNIPIQSVIEDPKEVTSYTAVVRKDQIPLVQITSNVTEGSNPTEIVDTLRAKMKLYEETNTIKNGVNYKFSGQQEEQAKEMAFLSKALGIAVFLILLIIVAQFNSFSTPSIIMLTVVLSLIGVLLGLLISRQSFVIMMTMIGIISLAGVVVNNAIVLIDYTNLIRKQKRDELGLGEYDQLPYDEIVKAAIEGGKTRLRPVLLTAITTVLGLIPLAIGFNIDFSSLLTTYDPKIYFGGDNNIFFAPMSWAIIYGLTFATFLTLVIIPSLYLLLHQLKNWIYGLFGWEIRSNL